MEPRETAKELSFQDLFDLEEIQKIQDAFAESMGFASLIVDVAGNPITKPSNFCHLCADLVRGTELGRRRCQESDAALGSLNSDGPIFRPCLSAGIWDGGTAITVGDRVIAKWLVGQVLDEGADLDKLTVLAREMGLDEAEYRAALSEVPRMSRARFESTCRSLYLMARQLSKFASENARKAEYIRGMEEAREALAQSESHFRSLFEAAPIPLLEEDFSAVRIRMLELERTGVRDFEAWFAAHPDELAATVDSVVLLRANEAYVELFGLAHESVGPSLRLSLLPTVQPALLAREFAAFARGERVFRENLHIERPAQGDLDLKLILAITDAHAEDWSKVFVSFVDVTKEKVIEEELQRNVKAKETLMRELEHRVKNGMNLISSLLSLEAARLPDEFSRNIFANAQDRIRSISLIYDLLSHSADSMSLDSYQHLEELVRLLRETYLSGRPGLVIESRIEGVSIDVKRAVSLGLIANELLTNAIKYAYPADSGGIIRFSFSREGEELRLSVSDEGKGLPPGYDFEASDSLGFKLVDMLSHQLRGRMAMDGSHGLKVDVVIPAAGS
jgi:two-component sensor histidine kinase/ligand-binding sensor protein